MAAVSASVSLNNAPFSLMSAALVLSSSSSIPAPCIPLRCLMWQERPFGRTRKVSSSLRIGSLRGRNGALRGRSLPGGKWEASMGGVKTGPASQYAKEMERVAAKEALLLAIKDAGGVEALMPGRTSDVGGIDVNERILNLERLNPTPRPTTSPMLEGLWQFKWVGARSPGLLAARVLLQRFPSVLASLEEINLLISDGCAKTTTSLKILTVIGSNVTVTSKLTVEGPSRMKEEYMEGLFATPTFQEGTVPSQIKGAYEQFVEAIQRLPDQVKETVTNGLKVPLAGTFQRQLLISYIDDEILIFRDESGIPEVLTRLNGNTTVVCEAVPEYVS